MADLRVDYARLDAARISLQRLATELAAVETRRDEMAELWVGREVRRAMRGFADDWDRHRQELLGQTHDLEQLIGGIVETFRGVEAALAGSLSVQGGGPGAGTVAR